MIVSMLTMITRVVNLHIFICAWTWVTEDGAVHWNLARASSLTTCADDAQRAWRHTVDTPPCVAMIIADGDGEATIVSSDDVEVSVCWTRDVQSRVLTRVVGLILLHIIINRI